MTRHQAVRDGAGELLFHWKTGTTFNTSFNPLFLHPSFDLRLPRVGTGHWVVWEVARPCQLVCSRSHLWVAGNFLTSRPGDYSNRPNMGWELGVDPLTALLPASLSPAESCRPCGSARRTGSGQCLVAEAGSWHLTVRGPKTASSWVTNFKAGMCKGWCLSPTRFRRRASRP